MINIFRLARGLGWFSIGLGLAELLDSQSIENFLGIRDRKGTVRFFGLREIAAGVGILSNKRPASHWLWARVGGDALDLAALTAALESKHAKKINVITALISVAGVTALDVYCAAQLTHRERISALSK